MSSGWRMAAADVEHGSHEVAHHVVQESVATDAVDQQSGRLLSPWFPKRRNRWCGAAIAAAPVPRALLLARSSSWAAEAVRAGEVGIGGGEAEEIVFAEKEMR